MLTVLVLRELRAAKLHVLILAGLVAVIWASLWFIPQSWALSMRNLNRAPWIICAALGLWTLFVVEQVAGRFGSPRARRQEALLPVGPGLLFANRFLSSAILIFAALPLLLVLENRINSALRWEVTTLSTDAPPLQILASGILLLFAITHFSAVTVRRSAGSIALSLLLSSAAALGILIVVYLGFGSRGLHEDDLAPLASKMMVALSLALLVATWVSILKGELHRTHRMRPLLASVAGLSLVLIPAGAFGGRAYSNWSDVSITHPKSDIIATMLLPTSDGLRLSILTKRSDHSRAGQVQGYLMDLSAGTGDLIDLGPGLYATGIDTDGRHFRALRVKGRDDVERLRMDFTGATSPSVLHGFIPLHEQAARPLLTREGQKAIYGTLGKQRGVQVLDRQDGMGAFHAVAYTHLRLFENRIWFAELNEPHEGKAELRLVSLDPFTGDRQSLALPGSRPQDMKTEGRKFPLLAAALGPNRAAVVASSGDAILMLDLTENRRTVLWQAPKGASKLGHLVSSHRGGFLFLQCTIEDETRAVLIDVKRREGHLLPECLRPSINDAPWNFHLSPDDRFLLVLQRKTVSVIDLESGRFQLDDVPISYEELFGSAWWKNDQLLFPRGRQVLSYDLSTRQMSTILN